MITAEAERIIRDFPLGIIATVTSDGRPAASPKGTFLVLDDMTLAYGDFRSPGTRRNLQKTAHAEVVFVDPFRRKGVRLAGSTEIIEAESGRFEELHPRWVETWGDLAKRVRALVLIHVDRVLPLTTPPYDDGATEDEMIALYKTKYAELYP
ncbi:MAG: pyridoxamine 5'-phosphate oxidase family protein [Rhodobacteraceae bacterium]|nr:pyridoxamine 5'-phosphate oxidase family protein [Paracoccaceae bacterium]